MISQAQTTIKYGYLSYQEVLKFMPEYAVAQTKLADLKQKYDNEMKRVEDEFNKKYEQFLEGQKDFAPTILRKRQVELQELIAKNIASRKRPSDCWHRLRPNLTLPSRPSWPKPCAV